MSQLALNTYHPPRLINGSGDGRTRPSSFCTSQGTSPPRTGTFTPLPPYSSPQPTWTQTEGRQHAKTPSDLLGLDINHTRKTSDTDILNFHLDTSGTDGKESFISPQVSPNALCPLTEQVALSGLDPKGDEKPLELRRNTLDEVTMSPNGLGISSAFSESSSRPVSQVLTSPTISSRRTSTTGITSSASRRDSVLSLNSAILEMIMENLNGVQASYYKAKCRISYPISMIESFRNNKTGHRYIVVSPPASSNIKLFFGVLIPVIRYGLYTDIWFFKYLQQIVSYLTVNIPKPTALVPNTESNLSSRTC